jgi:hypothetical protein
MADATGMVEELMQVPSESVRNAQDLIGYGEMNGLNEVQVDGRGSTIRQKKMSQGHYESWNCWSAECGKKHPFQCPDEHEVGTGGQLSVLYD